jgi:oxalate decarboxylase/phosphoglucose isomerase-like protein (cupin superfamily)
MSDPFTNIGLRARVHTEDDGSLGVIEFSDTPFVPQRFFWLIGIDPETTRASHAHRRCHQLLMCLAGEMTASITAPSGVKRVFRLHLGDMVHLEPLMWLDLTHFTTDGVLGVMASEPYDPSEYIDDFEELRTIAEDLNKSKRS